jgi:hypothetical protein
MTVLRTVISGPPIRPDALACLAKLTYLDPDPRPVSRPTVPFWPYGLRRVGSLAMLLAMRLASSRVSALAIPARWKIGVAVDIGESLSVGVYDLEVAV